MPRGEKTVTCPNETCEVGGKPQTVAAWAKQCPACNAALPPKAKTRSDGR